MRKRRFSNYRFTAAAASIILGIAVQGALAAPSASPKIVGNPTAGKATFKSTCAGCHTLKAAGAKGSVGPDLDKVSLPEATLVKAVTLGGATVMSKAAVAKYVAHMPAFKGSLSTAQIQNVAAFVYKSTHK